jgi:hypothetical protein
MDELQVVVADEIEFQNQIWRGDAQAALGAAE